MKVIDFNSIEPFFSQERDGKKTFTIRKTDSKDKRFRTLAQWTPDKHWGIRITNPTTGESFIREIIFANFLSYFDYRQDNFWDRLTYFYDCKIIVMGEVIEERKEG